MLKRKEFILGAAAGLAIAAVATLGGVIQWPGARAEPGAVSGRLTPSAGAPGLAFAPPTGAPLSFADIFQQVAPAVVQIDVKTRVQRGQGGFSIPGLPFDFGVPPGARPPVPEGVDPDEGETAIGAGSGFLISADGYIVTNNHVVENAEEITVRLADQRELKARLVGRDEDTDLAVIKIDGGDFPFVTFEEEAEPRVGDWVIAVGNPFGLGGSATTGIVSAKARDINDPNSPYTDYLQIDAAINRGNSGGPTFDVYGRVIGVNTAIYSPTGGSVGIGFAIPASVAKPITDRLMRGEAIQRGYLGVSIGTPDAEQLDALGLPDTTKGAVVSDVTPGGPAAAAGLQFADVVVTMNGRAVTDSTDLTRRVSAVQPGQRFELEILRDGRRSTVTVRSGVRPARAALNATRNALPANPDAPGGTVAGQAVAGLSVAPISPALRQRYGIPDGVTGLVVTGVLPGGDRRFEPGFVIQRVGSRRVGAVADLTGAVGAARQGRRQGLFIQLWVPGEGALPVVLALPES